MGPADDMMAGIQVDEKGFKPAADAKSEISGSKITIRCCERRGDLDGPKKVSFVTTVKL